MLVLPESLTGIFKAAQFTCLEQKSIYYEENLWSFQLFFPEHFLLVSPDLDCLFYLPVSVYIWIYTHRRQSKMLITCKSLSQPQGILLLLIHVLFCSLVGRQASVQWLESRTEVLGYLISKNVLLRKIRPCLQCRGILSPSVLRRSGDYISI